MVDWRAVQECQTLFPQVKLVTDKLLTHQQGIYTGGEAFSSVNLLLYIIEKVLGREAAICCSKIFQIDIGRKSQSPFIIFRGEKDHADQEIRQSREYIEAHYHAKLERLCARSGIDRKTFERRLKKVTGNIALAYIQWVKIEAAKQEVSSRIIPCTIPFTDCQIYLYAYGLGLFIIT